MTNELEIAGAASVGGLSAGGHHPVDPGKPCENCGTIVTERYCTRCGQLASDFHRPFFSLVTSSVADVFALDGRLWRTLPMLVFRPGRLTRNYLDGKRARYVPPFRMFLLASVIFFLTVFTLGDRLGWYKDWKFAPSLGTGFEVNMGVRTADDQPPPAPDPEVNPAAPDTPTIETLRERLQNVALSDAERQEIEQQIQDITSRIDLSGLLTPDGKVDRVALRRIVEERTGPGATSGEIEVAYRAAEHAAVVYENQDRFANRLREWAPRFSLLFMPILTLTLAMLHAWRRKVFVYDHAIAALHFQTFVYILLTILILLGALAHVAVGTLVWVGSLSVVAYLYRLLRVAYGSGRFMSVLRTFILLISGITVLSLLAVGLVLLSFVLT